ncbi:hypothetical protein M0R45_024509 [Rubus argutus]|uniref:Uncharacterized protein n=1 Tax=Rubus argutus TaxID=59490 RepID=A0AAW1WTE0_RUBAR
MNGPKNGKLYFISLHHEGRKLPRLLISWPAGSVQQGCSPAGPLSDLLFRNLAVEKWLSFRGKMLIMKFPRLSASWLSLNKALMNWLLVGEEVAGNKEVIE